MMVFIMGHSSESATQEKISELFSDRNHFCAESLRQLNGDNKLIGSLSILSANSHGQYPINRDEKCMLVIPARLDGRSMIDIKS